VIKENKVGRKGNKVGQEENKVWRDEVRMKEAGPGMEVLGKTLAFHVFRKSLNVIS